MLPFELTKDTPYLALSGELWSVFYEYFNRNWPCYKRFLLYIQICMMHNLYKQSYHNKIHNGHLTHVSVNTDMKMNEEMFTKS